MQKKREKVLEIIIISMQSRTTEVLFIDRCYTKCFKRQIPHWILDCLILDRCYIIQDIGQIDSEQVFLGLLEMNCATPGVTIDRCYIIQDIGQVLLGLLETNCATPGVTTDKCYTGYWTGVTWALRSELCYTRCYHRQVFFPGVLHSRFDVQHYLTAVFSILRFLIPLRKQERGNTSIIRAKLAG